MKRVLVLLLVVIACFSGCTMENKKVEESDLINEEITLYFGDSQGMYVVSEKRQIPVSKDITKEELTKEILEELIKGPKDEELYPTIPDSTKILKISLERDILYVDFSKEIKTEHWGGATGENMTLLSLANTVTEIEGISGIMPSVENSFLSIEHIIVEEPLIRDEKGIRDN